MYSILDESNNQKSTNKSHNAFTESFKNFTIHNLRKKNLRHTMRRIGSKNLSLDTCETNKRSLSCFDDKRCILKNGINTLAYRI